MLFVILIWFQHTAARRRLGPANELLRHPHLCFNTQPPEGGWQRFLRPGALHIVSTHSRPKAAGSLKPLKLSWLKCFNTQPPEGGWIRCPLRGHTLPGFQHTAARRRLVPCYRDRAPSKGVSTHSRPKAAGRRVEQVANHRFVSTHSRPKAAGLKA